MDLIEEIRAREKIRERIHIYCRAVDEGDWKTLRSCFGEGHKHIHGSFEGNADEFVAFARRSLEAMPHVHHAITNQTIALSDDGTRASSHAYFTSFHRLKDGETGEMMDWIVAGHYADELVLQGGEWLIVKREGVHHWDRYEPASPR